MITVASFPDRFAKHECNAIFSFRPTKTERFATREFRVRDIPGQTIL